MNPLIVKNIIYPLHELFLKRNTFSLLKEIRKTQWLSEKDIKEIQLNKIKDLLRHAYKTVPYYRRLMDKHDCLPDSVRDFDDFKKLPPLTKKNIHDEGDSLLSSNYDKYKLQKSATSGSTGNATRFYLCDRRKAYDKASEIRSREWLGLNPFDKSIWLWGRWIKGQTFIWIIKEIRDRLINKKIFPCNVLDGDLVKNFLIELKKYQPKYLYCYAGTISYIAKYMKDNHVDGSSLGIEAIITTAEILFEEQRDTIKEVFNCIVANEYGSGDAGYIAHECLHGRMHIQAEGIYVEVEDKDNCEDGEGELLITNLDSYAMPFIRYRIGDVGRLSNELCPCGRGLPIIGSLTGRTLDALMNKEGRIFNPMTLYSPVEGVLRYRIHQHTYEKISMELEVNDKYDKKFERIFKEKLEKLFGYNLNFTFKYVDRIETTIGGKLQFISSDVTKKVID